MENLARTLLHRLLAWDLIAESFRPWYGLWVVAGSFGKKMTTIHISSSLAHPKLAKVLRTFHSLEPPIEKSVNFLVDEIVLLLKEIKSLVSEEEFTNYEADFKVFVFLVEKLNLCIFIHSKSF